MAQKKKRGVITRLGMLAGMVIALSVGVIAVNSKSWIGFKSKAVMVPGRFVAVNTHPHFWKTGNTDYVGKFVEGIGANSQVPFLWIWSGPIKGGDPVRDRFVAYQKHSGRDLPQKIVSWERWQKTGTGTVWRFGGGWEEPNTPHFGYGFMSAWALNPGEVNATVATTWYASTQACVADQPGFAWPVLDGNEQAVTPISRKLNNRCTLSYSAAANRGGYAMTYYKENFGAANSGTRNSYCDRFSPVSLGGGLANAICKTSPFAGRFEQRYAIEENGQYRYGCEPTVYVWGNPESSSNNYAKWFRNGELVWADYRTGEVTGAFRQPSNNSYWAGVCGMAWNEMAAGRWGGWAYTGMYRLNPTFYQDLGTDGASRVLSAETTQIVFRAMSSSASGEFGRVRLEIAGKPVKEFLTTAAWADYAFSYADKAYANQIKLVFINDYYNSATNEDRNVWIDYVTVGGVKHEIEDQSTYSSGSWTSDNGCGSGYKKTNKLSCPNSYFVLRQDVMANW